MGTIPSGVPLGLRANIQTEFGSRDGVTPDNLLGFTGRDQGIPTAPALKYGDFVGKGRHTGREKSMKAFLAGAPYNPYNLNYTNFPNGLANDPYRRDGINFSDQAAPFVRATSSGGCGLYATLNATRYPSTIISDMKQGIASGESMQIVLDWYGRMIDAEHCVENTLITYGAVEDGTNSTTLNNLGGNSGQYPPQILGAASNTLVNIAGGQLRALRTSNTLRFRDMANISVSYGGGGCNGNGACAWFLLPNRWDITGNLGYSSGTTINAVFQPWEAVIINWRTGADNTGLSTSGKRLIYGSGSVLGAVMACNGNWYGGNGFSIFVNWTGAPQTFTLTNNTMTAQSIHKIYFVGDPYTFSLA